MQRWMIFLTMTLGGNSLWAQASGDARYNVPTGATEVGVVTEEEAHYLIKTHETKKQICSEVLRLETEEMLAPAWEGEERETRLIACLEQSEFTSKHHTYFVTKRGEKTLTRTTIAISGYRHCEIDFVRVFSHYRVAGDGRVEWVPSHLKAARSRCQ